MIFIPHQEARRHPEEEGDDLPPEVKAEAVRQFMQDHMRRWIDMEIPALGGTTPREVVKTKAGRRRILAMLRDQENWFLRSHPGVEIDFASLYRELGLEREG